MRLGAALACLALVLTACGSQPSGRPSDVAQTKGSGPTAVPAAGGATWVAAAGDIACPPGQPPRGNTCRQAATARLALDVRQPAYVFVLGDTQYEEGTYWQHLNSYAHSWGRLLHKTFPVVGNHEYRVPGANGYFRYFAGRTPPNPGYYRQTVNGWQVYFLNTNCRHVNCDAERAWLAAQMRANPSRCSMIVMHHPRYSSGKHGNQRVARGFWRIALAHRTDVALAGHDHNYERFARKNNVGDFSGRGILSYVVGTGGKSLFPMGSRKGGSQVFFNRRHGLLYLGLTPTGWSWEFRTIDNLVKDRGSRTCV